MIYINNDPEDFKNIFVLSHGNDQLQYDIVANDSIRYWLKT